MKKASLKVSILFLLSIILIQGCIKEDHFGKSSFKEIISFTLPLQLGTTQINNDSLTIRIRVSDEADLSGLAPTKVAISNFASLEPPADAEQDFTKPVLYTVRAEDGSEAVYKVFVTADVPLIQIPNSGFEQWYMTNNGYLQIGLHPGDTVWATSNAGVNTFGKVNVFPELINGSDTISVLETLDMGLLAQLVGQGIGAGSLFTGTFVLNLQNPVMSARMGTPFIGRPDSFSVNYKYIPGAEMMNGFGDVLPGADSVDIVVLLEDRSSQPVKRVATAWHRSPEHISEWTSLKLKLEYGPLASPKPYEIPVSPVVWGSGLEKPTHISVIFSSSARGNLFEGAPGSKLYVNDFKLFY
jgi:hypothetical protein